MTRKRLLIVDDDTRFADLVVAKLSPRADCAVSASGEDAVLRFQHQLRKNEPFDAVIMDIVMPGLSGHETVAKMRETERRNSIDPRQSFKLIMLTAHRDMKNVSSSFFRGGADAFVPKENFSDRLLEELRRLGLT
ncbi:response regulator [Pseudodesulfovibrio pelocollis]|uniref:response regulator n=1 Tax=Pseudodesulfovibrio pelocollis TaxID=3051432 RepID=UPI00255B04E2|nr:response regulator [Pseudodesulfovibrio sp. SB368]